ncbi:MAG: DUF3368 domain-containing protein [Prochlorotrichaceae cyanobacterium]|jgi:predicted nucleic acid-binding protein
MVVVSNTSPIHYLVLIEQIGLLPQLFQTVVIPQMVRDELSAPEAPTAVQSWITHPPDWLKIHANPQTITTSLRGLDAGETTAILLAQSLKADLLLLDDMKARRAAKAQGFSITGTLGILAEAASLKIIDLPTVVKSLQTTSFWVSESMVQHLLDRFT